MKKYILTTAIACFLFGAQAVYAAMVLIDVSPNIDLYNDPASARKNGNITTVWEIFNLKKFFQSNGKQFKSMKHRTAYDCKNELRQVQYSGFYSENDAEGELVDKQDFGLDAKWEVIDPTTSVYLSYVLVCNNITFPKAYSDLLKKYQKGEIGESEFRAQSAIAIKNVLKNKK